MNEQRFVSILMGSDSDWPVMQKTQSVLKKLQITCEVRVLSAHRTPEQTVEYIKDAEKRGACVFISAAGMAAHLAGATAAATTRPVIGVPLNAGSLGGFDALLSTVQMPSGIPVATVAIGSAGAENAAYLAAQILALSDNSLAEKIKQARAENVKKVLQKNVNIQAALD